MDFEEFKKYIEDNCNAKSCFFSKMTAYMGQMVEASDNDIYLTESQINYEVKKNWNTSLRNMYNNIGKEITTKRTDNRAIKFEKWLSKISELEVLDSFTESIDNIEFD